MSVQIIDRNKVNKSDTWDLEALYPSLAAIEGDFQKSEELIVSVGKFRGRLNEGVEAVRDALVEILELERTVERIYVYSSHQSDQDIGNSTSSALKDRALGLYSKSQEAISFFNPEIIRQSDSFVEELQNSDLLRPYFRLLDEVLRNRPHTLSFEEESLLAGMSELLGGFRQTYSKLVNADFNFGSIVIDGESHNVTNSSFVRYLRDTRDYVRRSAYDRVYATYASHKHSCASLCSYSVKKDSLGARVRKFPSSLERALWADHLPVAVYDKLIDTTSENVDSLHRYFEKRAAKLGKEKIHHSDVYVSLAPEAKLSIPYETAVELICNSLAPLGQEYVDLLFEGLIKQRWVDRYENKGKRSGAYSGGCYDSHPYILMNYDETQLDSIFTLAHEAGHSMHSLMSRRHQPYHDSGYTIFVAEVASTFNEILLREHLRKVWANNLDLIQKLVESEIDEVRSTFFRQVMFAEFEREIHKRSDNGKATDLDSMQNFYKELLQKYFGSSVEFSEESSLEFLRIPHFYSSFYVFKYATGLAASSSLAKGVLGGDINRRESYLGFLKSGCKITSLELLQAAGVDLLSAEPVNSVVDRFRQLVSYL